jgi:succinyl-CoA synthetase beta subunit
MRLHEFEATDIFEASGIPVPRRGVAETVEEALHVAGEIGYPVMAKAQVLVGGRGLSEKENKKGGNLNHVLFH